MAINFSAYPTLNARLLFTVSFGTNEENAYIFGYPREGKIFPLKTEEMGKDNVEHQLIDPRRIWNPELYGLYVQRHYTVDHYQALFGPDGIACHDATIGLALLWGSKSSKQCGAVPIGEIKNGQDLLTFKLGCEFPANQFCGKLELKTILYLKTPGNPTPDEVHLANQQGCNLGELDTCQIYLDGAGSMFPVIEINDPEGPLWDVDYSVEDSTFDSLDESFTLKLNTAHPAYSYINHERKTFVPQLFAEVTAQALMVLITTLQEDEGNWESIIDSGHVSSDSVARAVRYFKESCGFDFDSPASLSKSIREYLEKKATKWP